MAKLIIEINDAAIDDVCGIECSMKIEAAPESERKLSDATVLVLAKTMKNILPEITKALVEQNAGRKVMSTEVVQGQSLSQMLDEHTASRKAH
ncbi:MULTISPECIES: hypothetical protein [unclassified Shewanella]|uniref:hypothetical protein n=1 Tax=unclassified Shewanella TaxID=196818 RepID=UPI001564643F|nr:MULTISPECIES: hypothetical protein [unclassified Shewanella]MCU8043324.1 hypothetical protein [Shewanella sp. SM68]MCU8047698.1 hypothetical protein [Shewanella sp. SM65]NRD33820.1 hypothetical protein [Shewanella sp. DC2-4]